MKKDLSRRLEKQKVIVAAVAALMDEQGLKHVTILDICAAAGVSVGTFYHYFPSKDHIVPAMYDQLTAHMERVCAEELTQLEGAEAILLFFERYAACVAQWGTYANLLTIRHSLETKYDCEQRGTVLFNLLLEIISRGLTSGALCSPLSADVLTEQLYIIARGYSFELAKRGDGFPCAAYTRDTVSAVVASITPH